MMLKPRDGRRLRVAVVKLSSLGDVIHALPVARALRRAFPGAHLTWIVEAREHAILREHPDLDVVMPVDTRLWRRLIWRPAGARQVWGKLVRLDRRVRASGFDVALDLQGLIKSGILTAYTGARLRIGFSPGRCWEWPNCLFTNRHVTPPREAVHVVDQYLALLAPLGVHAVTPEFHIPLRTEAERRIEDFLGEQGIKRRDVLVALNPGAGRENKRWPVAHMRALAERLGTEPGVRILLLWGPDEVHMARQIRDGLSTRAVLAPPTDLDELSALLRRCSLLIANDTGPLHLGAALGTPCLGLYGPTSAARNGPYGARCRGLQSPDGTMAGLDPLVAFEAARSLLDLMERP
ncbi:MAG TPA: glycosyltransferase family 9 protein [Methylomirabilota bacterium]|jgi:lipopolysaccharide heptosyltransferase I|nr:glycosyltransferase family 9 protein [Methylomirabilota bacterium]